MAYKQLDSELWLRRFRRALLIGPPNSWKTTSLRTWPKPIAYLAYPGEQGVSSMPLEDGIMSFVPEMDPVEKLSAGAQLREVDQLTADILSGKHGQFQTFAGDGIHKLYDVIYAHAFADLGSDEEKVGGRAYGVAHKEFRKRLRTLGESPMPYVVMTAWSTMERDDPESKVNRSKHVWPHLPGTMGQDVVGEFGCVLYSKPGKEVAPGKFARGQWQTRPHGDVWGVGIKLPPELAAKVPTLVDQNWAELEKLVTGGV